jgi:hypothetical protein
MRSALLYPHVILKQGRRTRCRCKSLGPEPTSCCYTSQWAGASRSPQEWGMPTLETTNSRRLVSTLFFSLPDPFPPLALLLCLRHSSQARQQKLHSVLKGSGAGVILCGKRAYPLFDRGRASEQAGSLAARGRAAPTSPAPSDIRQRRIFSG